MKKIKSLKFGLILGISLIILLTQGVFGYVNYKDLINTYDNEVNAKSDELFQLIRTNFLSKIEAPINLLKYTAEEFDDSNTTLHHFETYLIALEKLYPFVDHIKLIDAEGYLVLQAPFDDTLTNASYANESFFLNQPSDDSVNWSNTYISPRNHQPVITASLKFGTYLMVADLDLRLLYEEMKLVGNESVTNISLVDGFGNYIFDKDFTLVERRMNYPNFDELSLNYDKSQLRNTRSPLILSDRLSPENSGFIIVELNYEKLLNQIDTYKYSLILRAILLVLFTFVFIMLLMRNVILDLNHLSKMSKSLINRESEAQDHAFSFSEINALALDFKKMSFAVREREEEAINFNSKLEKQVRERTESLETEIEERMKAEKLLSALNSNLEQRIEDRTLAVEISNRYLEETNVQLEEEIQEHTMTLMELRDREGQLEHALELARQGSIAKKQFIANMSHEIRTPMNGVLGMIGLLSETELNTVQAKYVDTLSTAANTLMYILNDILDYSKIEAGKITLNYQLVDVRLLIGDLIDLFSSSALKKNIDLKSKIDNDVPQYIISDITRLKQILSNLIGNAIKFTYIGYVCIECVVSQNHKKSSMIEFRIKDTGIGITKEEQLIIFERFEQGKLNNKDRPQGTGLGLAISKMLVELMSGEITCKSVHLVGCTFSVKLPIETESDCELETGHNALAIKTNNDVNSIYNDLEILIAEDDEVSGFIVKSMLEKQGIQTDVAVNGRVTLELLDKKNYDLLLLDINMPLMDGLEAASEIRRKGIKSKLGREIPIIAMTAFASDEDRGNCIKAGCNNHIAKPIDFKVMFQLIDDALELTNGGIKS